MKDEMKKVFVVTYKAWNWDDCDSYLIEIISVNSTHDLAIKSAERHVKNWCINVEWDEEKMLGKVDVVGYLVIVDRFVDSIR